MAEQTGQSGDASSARRGKQAEESLKETFESIIIAFVLAFVFRAYVVEAFVIPTGSMAPTLLGAHVSLSCDACGYHFKVGADISEASTQASLSGPLHCPMCHYTLSLPPLASSGDRILVQKYMYSFVEPRRWDVVVFKAPHEPGTNYIKRLVGLPMEEVQVIEGNIFVRPLDAHDQPAGPWRIARKTDTRANPHAYRIQRTVWQPIYHSSYVPLDAHARRWRSPWNIEQGQWLGLGTGEEAGRSYVYRGGETGRIAFDFNRIMADRPGLHAYNQGRRRIGVDPNPDLPFEDVRIAAGFQPADAGLTVQMQTTARIDATSEPVTLLARIGADGTASIGRMDADGLYQPFDTVALRPFVPHVTREVELWFVDQEMSLWVDGEVALKQRFEIDIEVVRERPTRSDRPAVAIVVGGAPATLHRVEVDRDLYYVSKYGDSRGTLVKNGEQQSNRGSVVVRDDQFFCLGDNSPASHDGRTWESVDPWVAQRKFSTHPAPGLVPRRLMMGRAFFVYYPAPYGWSVTSNKLIPNFAEMRFIH